MELGLLGDQLLLLGSMIHIVSAEALKAQTHESLGVHEIVINGYFLIHFKGFSYTLS